MSLRTFFKGDQAARLAADTLTALSRAQALIEFEPDGTIISANENFLRLVGYELAELEGQHHSLLVSGDISQSPADRDFWTKFQSGAHQAGRFKRLGKNNTVLWLEASYAPLLDRDGKVYRIIASAIDVTARHTQSSDARGQLTAICRSQATIEFDLDGMILAANPNFCEAMGYQLTEIVGRHHRMFVSAEEAHSTDYAQFWGALKRGEYRSAEFKRVGKGGREVWIQASYNPIFDEDGQPYKVVKYATDITARKSAVNQLSFALGRLAKGELGHSIGGHFPDELDIVRQALNETIERFRTIVLRLRESSATLRSATTEILHGSNDLAERTNRQAAAIEETTASIDQLSSFLAENARKADAARMNAQGVSSQASAAGEVMTKANAAMLEVSAQAAKISNVIGLIDDIAFQTNLLALNASVEAARAGDAGKGFAVVAVEVRRLARSAASASSDVKALVGQSADAISNGTKLVAVAAEQLRKVVGEVHESTHLIDDIASSNRAQADSIAHVASAVRDMDEMTQHNAALVEQTNAAIEQTETQANAVDQMVSTFRTDVAGQDEEQAVGKVQRRMVRAA